MNTNQLKKTIKTIVHTSFKLAVKHTGISDLPVSYACVFSKSEDEFQELLALVSRFGKEIQDTYSGPIYHIDPIKTKAGLLKLVKIRKPDEKVKHMLGYADFTLPDYELFKNQHIDKPNYHVFDREKYEVLELKVENSDVGVFFANPPLDKQLLT